MNLQGIDIGEFGRNILSKLLKVSASNCSYDDILDECTQKKKKYTDDEFPPTRTSLIKDWNEDDENV